MLDLQKSNYGNYYELNIKLYVQGAFGNNYRRNKELVKKDVGDVFTRQPDSFNDLLNLENTLTIEIRTKKLKDLFELFIEPFVSRALSLQGLSAMETSGDVYLLPAVRDEITRLFNP